MSPSRRGGGGRFFFIENRSKGWGVSRRGGGGAEGLGGCLGNFFGGRGKYFFCGAETSTKFAWAILILPVFFKTL